MTEYDFTKTINTAQLQDEMATAGLPAASRIDTVADAVQIFYTDALTSEQETSLGNVVSAHVASYNYVPAATQAQITLLLSYLNNANMTIANTARACIVANIAPRMPAGLVATINAQIATALGL